MLRLLGDFSRITETLALLWTVVDDDVYCMVVTEVIEYELFCLTGVDLGCSGKENNADEP